MPDFPTSTPWLAVRVCIPLVLAAALLVLFPGHAPVAAQASEARQAPEETWFGLPLPPPFQPHVPPVILGPRTAAPASVPPGEEGHRDLEGEAIRSDLIEILAFSRQSREEREIGEGGLWGRIAGFPSGRRTIEWAAREFRAAGIDRVEIQEFAQEEGASLWLPLSWEARLLGGPGFGPGSDDVVLESAMPLFPSEIEGGRLAAPLVYVGSATAAELEHIDVEGRIAVQEVIPQGHMVFERTPTVPRAQELFRRGAVAVVNLVLLPGNERSRDFSNCGGPCFNLGGRDGIFLRSAMERAAEAGVLDEMRMELSLEAERFSGLSAENAVAVLPGTRSEETLILNAHADAWFDGAGDNGDGLAVLVALSRHFAREENRLERTLVLVASAGHHSSGLHGPRSFVAMNPELTANAQLVFNIEHVAQRNISPARSLHPDGYREWTADAAEAPIVAGVTNEAPFLEDLVARGVLRYGTNFVSGTSTMASGEGGGYASLGVVRMTAMQAPPLYHTSGEVLEMISVPGLERMARFLAYFVREVDRAPAAAINP